MEEPIKRSWVIFWWIFPAVFGLLMACSFNYEDTAFLFGGPIFFGITIGLRPWFTYVTIVSTILIPYGFWLKSNPEVPVEKKSRGREIFKIGITHLVVTVLYFLISGMMIIISLAGMGK